MEREIREQKICVNEESRVQKNRKELQVYQLSNEIEAWIRQEPGKLFSQFLQALENQDELELFTLRLNQYQRIFEDMLPWIEQDLLKENYDPLLLETARNIKHELTEMIKLSSIEFFWRELYLLIEKASPVINIDEICERISKLISGGLALKS